MQGLLGEGGSECLVGVFDGHGPMGCLVSETVRDRLPERIAEAVRALRVGQQGARSMPGVCRSLSAAASADSTSTGTGTDSPPPGEGSGSGSARVQGNPRRRWREWKQALLREFQGMEGEVKSQGRGDVAYLSGTSVVLAVLEGNFLVVGHLGDSRAILCRAEETTTGAGACAGEENTTLRGLPLTAEHRCTRAGGRTCFGLQMRPRPTWTRCILSFAHLRPPWQQSLLSYYA